MKFTNERPYADPEAAARKLNWRGIDETLAAGSACYCGGFNSLSSQPAFSVKER